MDDYKLLKKMFIFGLPIFFILLFIILFSAQETATGSDEIVVATTLTVPFSKGTYYNISSEFGIRRDPFNYDKKFHSGTDLSTSCGTPVLASGNGIVVDTGKIPDGLGNYVYIKHEFDNKIIFTAYGHLLDNSIMVYKNQIVKQGDQIASVGSTGRSTGCHLHFMIMNGKISHQYQDLINPRFVVTGLK